MIVIAFLVGTWWMTRRATKIKCDPDVVLSLALISLIFGWVGGRLFYVIHYWKTQFAHQPAQILNLTAGGFEVYGGLLVAAAACILYLLIRRLPVRLYADLTAPSLLFGMGVGRIGCFLVGCCWGAQCPELLPWAVRFPGLSGPQEQQWADRIVTIPAELIIVDPASGLGLPIPQQILKFKDADVNRLQEKLAAMDKDIQKFRDAGNQPALNKALATRMGIEALFDHLARFETSLPELRSLAARPEMRSAAVHPAQIYSAIGPLLLAWLLNAWFFRRRRHGTVMALAMILYGTERFIEEMVRSDNPLDTFGLTVSQGVSILVVAGGVLWWWLLTMMPLRSSRPGIPVKNQPPPQTAPQAV
jgi:phosphatidylglycerol:prolipoprotein diacylglycerol transferase